MDAFVPSAHLLRPYINDPRGLFVASPMKPEIARCVTRAREIQQEHFESAGAKGIGNNARRFRRQTDRRRLHFAEAISVLLERD
ncbi:hypothetical protein HA462_16335 [Rhizobium leguminosarum bv. trifolii]|nr:hypothetical protein [Rhizobium leguminosarum]QIO66535.1 hypothetical protein HA462_16335 [Rhizobium leguminosarum bv. trifolii]